MTHYLIQPADRIFVKDYVFLSFTRNMGKFTGKKISKIVSSKCNKKRIDHAKQSATNAFKIASKRAVQKTAEATGDLTGNKIADNVTKFSRTSPQNNSETVTNEEENIGLARLVNLQLQWSAKCFSVPDTVANQVPTFNITDTNLYVLVVTLSTQNNVELLKQLESGF